MSKRANFQRMLLVMVTAGLLIPLIGSGLSSYVFPDTYWQHLPFHSLIEGLGSTAALLLAGLLLMLRPQTKNKSNIDNFWIASALISMGLLDGFHAATEPGNTFVWLHSIATAIGGLCFAMAWSRWSKSSASESVNWVWAFAAVACLLGFSSIFYPEILPRMTNEHGEFTLVARGLNIGGGLLFYVASLHFILRYLHEKDFDAFLFGSHTMLFGSAGMLFEQSQLWDLSWWWWHMLRLAAYTIAFWFVINYYLKLARDRQDILSDLTKANQTLSHQTRELQASKQRFELAVQGSGDGLWDWHITDNKMFFSPRWKTMLGYVEDEIEGSFLEWQELIHPSDLGKVLVLWTQCMDGESDFYSIAYRMKTKAGHYIWVQSRAITVKDAAGNVYRMAGSHTDINAQKQAESELYSYQQGLEELITKRTNELEQANQRLQQLVSVDGLTGISNRRAFDQSIEREWNRCKRDLKAFSLLMIDVDFFKAFNDEYGHIKGDKVLKQIAESLAGNTKRATDVLARYGGEEFAVILPDVDQPQCQETADKMLRDIIELKIPSAALQRFPFVSVSIGAGTFSPGKHDDWQSFLEQVDQALYQAKNNGRNQVVMLEQATDDSEPPADQIN